MEESLHEKISKICRICEQELAIENYYRSPRNKGGYSTECKICHNKRTTQWISDNKDRCNANQRSRRQNNRDTYLKYVREYYDKNKDNINSKKKLRRLLEYGITQDQYNKILKDQNFVCAICLQLPNGKYKKLCIDHNHESGVVRGLLCVNCNRAIGYLQDNPSLARILALYVERDGNMYYDYECINCKHQWEEEQSIKDDALTQCPSCKQETAKRLITGAPAFILVGGGWAKEGYSNK